MPCWTTSIKILNTYTSNASYLETYHSTLRGLIRRHDRWKTSAIRAPASGMGGGTVPTQFLDMALACLPMTSGQLHYWWRAVALSYLIRPNPRTLTWLAQQRACSNCKHVVGDVQRAEHGPQPHGRYRTSPWTYRGDLLPAADVLSVYIRHGDKGGEMRLVPTSTYVRTMQSMFENGWVGGDRSSHPNSLPRSSVRSSEGVKRVVFLGTETPTVLEEVKHWCRLHNFTLLYTDLVDRRDTVSGGLNRSVAVFRPHQGHPPLEYLSMILNLDLSLRSAAWVCTLASNWCRVVDELRSTVAFKAEWVYADLSKETCSVPPCISGSSSTSKIASFGWRRL